LQLEGFFIHTLASVILAGVMGDGLDPASPEYEEAFWQEQEAAPYWTVPIAHGGEMPWLKYHERGLLVAIQRAHQLGRTGLSSSSPSTIIDSCT
jgi:hypothetical protein